MAGTRSTKPGKIGEVKGRIGALAILGAGVLLLAALALLVRLGGPEWTAAVIQSQVIALTNDERAQNSVGQLSENTLLDQAAKAKAADMASKGYFAHTGPDGKTPWQWILGAGYDYRYAGENLAVRFNDSKDVVDAWMASPTHRDNIVKPQYTQIGVGIADGMYQGQPATFVVQYFGTPMETAAQAAPQAVAAAPRPAPAPVVSAAATASPTIAGAETAVPAAIPVQPAASLWERFTLFVATTLHSLLASVVQSSPAPVVIGETGAHASR